MTEFKSKLGYEASVTPSTHYPDAFYVHSDHWHYDNAVAPIFAAAVLEAGGVELTDQEHRALDTYTPHPVEDHEEDVRTALYCLKRALIIREFHAKPKVTKGQVESVRRVVDRGPTDPRDLAQNLLDEGWTFPGEAGW